MKSMIPIIIIIASIVIIAVILIRKFPKVALIDTSRISKEQQIEVKKALIENRLQRKLKVTKVKLQTIFKPLRIFFENFSQRFKEKAKAFEEKYYEKQRNLLKKKPELVKQKIQTLFEEGEKLMRAGDLAEAEKKYIEIIKLSPRNILAYRNLGNIYLKQKKYQHARETFGYNLKLCLRKVTNKNLSNGIRNQVMLAYRDLGLACKSIEEYEQALGNFQKALELEPNSPKNLDLLIETSIILENKTLAKKTLEKLKEVNPENQKIMEFEKEIKNID